MRSSDSQLRSPGVLTAFGARVLDQLSNRPVPLGAGAADVGATDFGSTSEPDTLMVLSPPVGFALVASVTSATVNDPLSTPDDNAAQMVIPGQKSASGKLAALLTITTDARPTRSYSETEVAAIPGANLLGLRR